MLYKFIIHFQDYHKQVSFNSNSNKNHFPSCFLETIPHQIPFPRIGSKDLLVTHYDCEENQQKTLPKYAINQIIRIGAARHRINNFNSYTSLKNMSYCSKRI